MTAEQPTVDVVISALNEEHSIDHCIDALKRQNYPHELVTVYVVVDQRTTDNTAEVAGKHGATVVVSDQTGIAMVRHHGFESGKSELVAFLDAHCLVKPNWISEMVKPFSDPMVGASQGMADSVCASPVVKSFADKTYFASDERFVEHTVSARFSPYPWILGGTSMFRRRAIEETGRVAGCPCDDTDRSWKVILEGYQLVAVKEARLTHHDSATLVEYLKKRYSHGVGAAQLAYAYGFEGVREGGRLYAKSWQAILHNMVYSLGYLAEKQRISRGVIKLPKCDPQPVQRRFRPRFKWTDDSVLQISPQVIYWRIDDDRSVCVQLLSHSRVEFDGVSNLIFRQLISGQDRETTCDVVCNAFDAERRSVEDDVDEFIEHLRQEGLLNVLASGNERRQLTEAAAPA